MEKLSFSPNRPTKFTTRVEFEYFCNELDILGLRVGDDYVVYAEGGTYVIEYTHEIIIKK